MTREAQVEKTAHTKTQDGKNLVHMKTLKTASTPEAQLTEVQSWISSELQ